MNNIDNHACSGQGKAWLKHILSCLDMFSIIACFAILLFICASHMASEGFASSWFFGTIFHHIHNHAIPDAACKSLLERFQDSKGHIWGMAMTLPLSGVLACVGGCLMFMGVRRTRWTSGEHTYANTVSTTMSGHCSCLSCPQLSKFCSVSVDAAIFVAETRSQGSSPPVSSLHNLLTSDGHRQGARCPEEQREEEEDGDLHAPGCCAAISPSVAVASAITVSDLFGALASGAFHL